METNKHEENRAAVMAQVATITVAMTRLAQDDPKSHEALLDDAQTRAIEGTRCTREQFTNFLQLGGFENSPSVVLAAANYYNLLRKGLIERGYL